MRRRFPDNRYRYVKQAVIDKKPPENETEKALYDLYTGTGTDENVIYALEIFSNIFEQEILNSWFLAGAKDNDIEAHLGIPEDVAHTYRHLFFDTTQFRDELDIYSWVLECEQHEWYGSRGVALLKQALTGGLDALAWVYSRNREVIDPRKVMENIMADAYFRSRIYRGNPIISRGAKESHTYMATALKAGDLLARHSPQQVTGISDLIIKLEHRDSTIPVSDLNTEDILH